MPRKMLIVGPRFALRDLERVKVAHRNVHRMKSTNKKMKLMQQPLKLLPAKFGDFCQRWFVAAISASTDLFRAVSFKCCTAPPWCLASWRVKVSSNSKRFPCPRSDLIGCLRLADEKHNADTSDGSTFEAHVRFSCSESVSYIALHSFP